MTAREVHRSLVEGLRRAGVGDVDDSPLARALYSSDASLYRVPPLAVVRPRHRDEVEAVLALCREHAVPVTARGAGTSIAGNAVGPGVVLDHSRHLGRVLSVDAAAGTAVVEPGTVHAHLQAAARPHGWRFGPDPSTHTRCTVGGMVGNNACGARALGYGRTSDNVLGLEVLTASGETLRLHTPDAVNGPATAHPAAIAPGPALVASARELVGAHLGVVRTEFGRFGRQISGYALEHLLPERGGDLTRTLVGSEGTLALLQQVTVRLVRDEPHRLLVLLGFPDIGAAADAAPATLAVRPTACEGMDRRLLEPLFRSGRRRESSFPAGGGMLFVELAGDDPAELRARADRLLRDVGTSDARVVDDPAEAASVWSVREDAAGIAAQTPDGAPAHAGWEDAAVPAERLGSYVRAFDALLAEHRLHALPYGHFGDGCLHVRIDFPLDGDGSRGRAVYRRFVDDAAALVAEHGGSLSGEHGDGRARSGLLGAMYSPEALAVQAGLKRLLDPENLLNPGVLVDPDAPDDLLRATTSRPPPVPRPPALAADAAELTAAAHRCTGVGTCLATSTDDVMCPSYRATRDEKDSTRGRARVLQELAQGASGLSWDSPAVTDALDLCLGCKACARDCPTGVDLARLRSEALHQRFAGRRRPLTHRTLGRLPRWADLAARAPRLVNAATQGRLGPLVARAGGIDPRRSLPRFAERTFLGRSAGGPASTTGGPAPNGAVALWVDTFTDHFAPEVAEAAVRVLTGAGYAVHVVDEPVCCGLTEISTGRLERARGTLRPTVRTLAGAVADGIPLVGLEPSCLTVLRDDALHLLPDSEDARRVAAAARPLARLLLDTPGWEPPDLTGVAIVAQPHCHEHAATGWAAEEDLLRRSGADLTVVRGCCGLAGNWGVERGHHDVSVAIAESALLPAVRALGEGGVVCADGFSCRTQVADLAGRGSRHLAEVLDEAVAAALVPRPGSAR